MVKNYAEWKEAVNQEYASLNRVWPWLSDDGRNRERAFMMLAEAAEDTRSACGFLHNYEKLLPWERAHIGEHAALAMKRLREYAEIEKKNFGTMEDPYHA